MANEFAALGSALYGCLGTVQYSYHAGGTATTSGTLGCYDTLAPQGVNAPYVIFQLQDSLDEYTFGTKSGESADYLVKAVSNRQYATMQAFAIYDQAHEVLQDAALSVNGHTTLRVRRTSRVQYRDADSYWHVGGIYRIDIWET